MKKSRDIPDLGDWRPDSRDWGLKLNIEQFAIGENQHIDPGDLALTPDPVFFRDEQVCVVPFQGGVCEFSVKLT
jgi:hypothetical protein